MKKIIFFLIPMLFFSAHLFSQEETETEPKWAVKAYVNGSFYSTSTVTQHGNDYTEIYDHLERNIGKISPAISYTKGKFVQELELVDIRINRVVNSTIYEIPGQVVTILAGGGKSRRTELSLRYLASGIFKPFKSKNISLGIGGSAQPHFFRHRFDPITSANFPYRNYQIGINIAAVPQIEYDFYKHFFINLSAPIELFDISIQSHKIENPLIPSSERRTSDLEAIFLPKKYHLRMGLGLRF